jgi:hypothetical protein
MARLLLLATCLLLTGCAEPFIVFAGGALPGEVTDPPVDWTPLNSVEVVQLESNPQDPYSVNIWAAGIGPNLYIATSADGTNWTEFLDEDRDVRLRIEDKVYALEAVPVTSSDERAIVAAEYVRKYGVDKEDNWVSSGRIYRLDRR